MNAIIISNPRRYKKDSEGIRRLVYTYKGVDGYFSKWTERCSGCFEQGESGGRIYLGTKDPKTGMDIGVGCHECGYTGKSVTRWWCAFEHCGRCGGPIKNGRCLDCKRIKKGASK